MEAIYVLAIVDGFYYLLLADVLGQRQLHDETIHLGVAVEAVYLGQQLFLGDVILKSLESTRESTRFACQHLVLHIRLAASVVAYQYGGQMRAAQPLCQSVLHLLAYFALDGSGSGFSVYQFHLLSSSIMRCVV